LGVNQPTQTSNFIANRVNFIMGDRAKRTRRELIADAGKSLQIYKNYPD
jgi:hypothetical protein